MSSSPQNRRRRGWTSKRRLVLAHYVRLLLERLRLEWLLDHLPPRIVWSIYVLLNSFVTIALLVASRSHHRQPIRFSPRLGQLRTCTFSRRWRRRPVRGTRSWDMPLVCFAVSAHSRCCMCSLSRMVPPTTSTGRAFWPRQFRFRSPVRLCCCSVSVILHRVQELLSSRWESYPNPGISPSSKWR